MKFKVESQTVQLLVWLYGIFVTIMALSFWGFLPFMLTSGLLNAMIVFSLAAVIASEVYFGKGGFERKKPMDVIPMLIAIMLAIVGVSFLGYIVIPYTVISISGVFYVVGAATAIAMLYKK